MLGRAQIVVWTSLNKQVWACDYHLMAYACPGYCHLLISTHLWVMFLTDQGLESRFNPCSHCKRKSRILRDHMLVIDSQMNMLTGVSYFGPGSQWLKVDAAGIIKFKSVAIECASLWRRDLKPEQKWRLHWLKKYQHIMKSLYSPSLSVSSLAPCRLTEGPSGLDSDAIRQKSL